jgi:lysophospholipase L1-like esterase
MALAGFVTAGTLPAAAAPGHVQYEYVALGDSYAAGVGATSDDPQPFCGRTDNGYPELLDNQGRIGPVENVACFGATTSIVAGQVSELELDTRLVTLTVGGNDLSFRGVLITCSESPENCLGAIEVALKSLEDLGINLLKLYTDIADAAPEARIVVTGYPILFEPPDAEDPGAENINALNAATADLNDTIEQAVAAANAADINIHYVDVTEEFAGHGIGCTDSPNCLFINEPPNPAPFHPNDNGYNAYADAISAALPGGWLKEL